MSIWLNKVSKELSTAEMMKVSQLSNNPRDEAVYSRRTSVSLKKRDQIVLMNLVNLFNELLNELQNMNY